MHSAQFLAAQIVLSVTISAQAAFHSVKIGGRELGEAVVTTEMTAPAKTKVNFVIVDEKVLRNYVQKSVENIKAVSRSSKYSTQQKLDFIKTTTEAVAQYREKNWSKSAYAEYEMDLTIKPYESFPESKNFKAQQCEKYQYHLIMDWAPTAQDLKPSQHGVSEALSVLKQICKS